MAISNSQRNKVLGVVNVFETGSVTGNYGAVSLYNDGPGGIKQITYGRSQTTEFGNLKTMLKAYIDANGIEARNIAPFLSNMGKTPSLCTNTALLTALKNAGKNDPIMKKVQDELFDMLYYTPAYKWFVAFKFTEALSLLVIYDSFIHSGGILGFLRERFAEPTPLFGGDEKRWIKQYVDTRHNWLLTHSNKILRNTVYRTQCFKDQIGSQNWDLSKVISANGTNVG